MRTHIQRTSRRGGEHSISPGFYVETLPSGIVLHIYRVGKRWFWRKFFEARSEASVREIHSSRPPMIVGWPTRDMAISAAKGNRAS